MTQWEAVFFWSAVWVYGFSAISYLYGIVFRKERGIEIGLYLAMLGFACQSVSMGIRWEATGHPPVKESYENSLLGAWFILTIFFAGVYFQRRLAVVGVIIIPIIMLMLGNGVFRNPVEHQPLSPPYKSNWLWFHVLFAWVAYGSFCLAAGLGGLQLIKSRAERLGKKEGILSRVPDAGKINDLTLRVIMFGFLALTVEIGAGAIWAYGLWGRYWGWDPIETWSLITWLIYGTYIHLGVTLGWRGNRMAWLAISAILAVFVTFGGIGYLGGIHTTIM